MSSGTANESVHGADRVVDPVQAQALFSALMAQSGEGITLIDGGGRIVLANHRFAAMCGYEREAVHGMNQLEFLPPGEELVLFPKILRGESGARECPLVRKDGSTFQAEIYADPVRLEGELYSLATVRDISERRRGEEALRALAEGTASVTGAEFFPVLASHLARALGLRNALVGVLDRDPAFVRTLAVHAGDRPLENKLYALAGTPCDVVYRQGSYHCPEGVADRFPEDEVLRVMGAESYLGEAMLGSDGRALGHLCVVHDEPIVDLHRARSILKIFAARAAAEFERQQAGEVRREALDRLATLIGALPDTVQFKDGAGRWLVVNARALELFGLQGADWHGSSDLELGERHPELRDVLRSCWESDQRAWEIGERILEEEVIPSAEGDRHYEVIKEPLFTPEGERSGLIIVGRDVTDRVDGEVQRKRLEAQLHHSRKMEALGQLAGGVAHDFNNLLTAILGNVELASPKAERLGVAGRPVAESLGQIGAAANQAAATTRKLLAFSRRQVGKVACLEPAELLREMHSLLRKMVAENIELTIETDDDVPPILAAQSQVEQMIVDLVLNAVDALPDGGEIGLSVRAVELPSALRAVTPPVEAGRYAAFEVVDDGTGMSQETKERLFEPFFSTKPLGEGSGLGLATVYGFVTQCGGGVAVTSEPGEGTSFRAYFPEAHESARTALTDQESWNLEPAGKTVLVCEDQPMVCELTSRVLEAAGFSVLSAANGREALERVAECEGGIDLLVTDVVMPEMNGEALAQQLRSLYPQLRVLFVSGYTAESLSRHFRGTEELHFLAKPFRPTDLLERVHEVLARPQTAS